MSAREPRPRSSIAFGLSGGWQASSNGPREPASRSSGRHLTYGCVECIGRTSSWSLTYNYRRNLKQTSARWLADPPRRSPNSPSRPLNVKSPRDRATIRSHRPRRPIISKGFRDFRCGNCIASRSAQFFFKLVRFKFLSHDVKLVSLVCVCLWVNFSNYINFKFTRFYTIYNERHEIYF